MVFYRTLFGILGFFFFVSCDPSQMGRVIEAIEPTLMGGGAASGSLGASEVVAGLKQALKIGSKNAALSLHQKDAYFRNPGIKIFLPQEAKAVADTLKTLGLSRLIGQVELSLNRAAEDAAIKSKPIFWEAITSMSIQDALGLLRGPNDGATRYLKTKTLTQLVAAFKPQISRSLVKVDATKYWSQLMGHYNSIPFVQKINPDLADYVTTQAIEGVFVFVAQEEQAIRRDPAKRVTDLLKRVFGS